MASAVHCQLNPQVRLFVPTAMTSKLAYITVEEYSTVQYSTAAESGRKEKSLRVSTRFAPETEDGRGDAGWDG